MTGPDIRSASGLASSMLELPGATLCPLNLATDTKKNMTNEMPCCYGTLRITARRIWHQVSHRACAEVSSSLKVSRRPSLKSQWL